MSKRVPGLLHDTVNLKFLAGSKPKTWEATEAFILDTQNPTIEMIQQWIPSDSPTYLNAFYREYGLAAPVAQVPQVPRPQVGPNRPPSNAFRAFRSPLP